MSGIELPKLPKCHAFDALEPLDWFSIVEALRVL
jgi:hypothetical protein